MSIFGFYLLLGRNLLTKIWSPAATHKAPASPTATHTVTLVTNANPWSLDVSYRPVLAAR